MLITEGSGKRRLKTNTTENSARYNFSRRPPKSCETTKMDIQLIELSPFFTSRERQGFLDITLPSPTRRPLFVCFPLHYHLYRQVHLLGQAACRQMGHAVASSVIGKRVPMDTFSVVAEDDGESSTTTTTASLVLPLPKGIGSVSWECDGYEQSVGQCAWYEVRMEGCRMLTELTCGECQRTVKASSGFLKTPGYPLAHYYDMTCEWTIEVPDSHSVSLSFNYLCALPPDQSDFSCATDKPYIEIVYGVQGSFHIDKHCDFRSIKNVTIPYHKVHIRYFSGLYHPKGLHVFDKKQGLAIAFKALPDEPYSYLIDALIIILVCVICFVGLLYFVRKTICFRIRSHFRAAGLSHGLLPNAPGREELEKAYEFQRCRVQPDVHYKPGLRLRSNGSRNNSADLRAQGTNISDRIRTTFRKFSSNSHTPRTIIPASLKSSQTKVAKFQMISKLKANLLDRYSGGSSNSRKDSCSSVFLPPAPPVPTFNFSIYKSTSSEPKLDPPHKTLRIPPQETAI
ncbi:hypothetical protein JTE90_001326 [Oedothorax gibbosus]|uniref:CUB domain-containing protein n=1 Tax=Oedothorax gibbosus TaxID=931172 RepID=A0AAV6V2Y8_9ARAC|nr:hypothetical protein JTE90_001326 [Oedothorax gibbosus]